MNTIKYKPRKTEADYNGPLSWVSKKEAGKEGDKPYFVAEISELDQISDIKRHQHFRINDKITVKNTENGRVIVFKCYDIDMNDGDTCGWHFKSVEGADFYCEMLIIND